MATTGQFFRFFDSDWKNFTTLVAVSGGADSVFLLRIAAAWWAATTSAETINSELHVLHVNHATRGVESDNDEEFVRELAGSLSLPIHVERPGSPNTEFDSSNRGMGREAIWRRLRYEAFERVASRIGARYVFTGHTLDDQVETVLFRLFRGTGIEGLAGIPTTRALNPSLSVMRPILAVSRTQVIECLQTLGQSFREDSSNQDCRFSRNRLRHQTLPELRDQFGAVDPAINNLSRHACEQTAFLNQLAKPIEKRCFQINTGEIRILRERFRNAEPLLARLAVRNVWMEAGFPVADMTFARWNELCHAIRSGTESGTYSTQFPGGVRLQFHGESCQLKVLVDDRTK